MLCYTDDGNAETDFLSNESGYSVHITGFSAGPRKWHHVEARAARILRFSAMTSLFKTMQTLCRVLQWCLSSD